MSDRYDPDHMEDHTPRGSSWPLYFLGGLLVAGVLSLAAWNIELPYLAYSPGPVSDAGDVVVAEGVETFPSEGELLMLTVSSQDVNIFEAVVAGVDPGIDLVRRDAVRRADESDDEYRERVLAQMDTSQEVAIEVALGYLGHEMVPVGVLITEVSEDVPAAEVLQPGDIIETVDGSEIVSFEDLTSALDGLQPGDVIEVEVARGDKSMKMSVEMAAAPEDGGAVIGVRVHQLDEPPFPISLETGVVGGPSAGMMQTIAIIDALTEGDMTMGRVVAGTGTINSDGTVGSIGGIRQKVVAAEAAGAEFMLLPERNYERALTAERDSMELIPVASVDEALAFFDSLDQPAA